MNNFILYWKESDIINKLKIVNYILKLPFFLIHEISHIIVTIVTGKLFTWEFHFFKKENDKLIIYGLDMEVYGEVDFYVALGSFIPTITYISMLVLSICLLISIQSIIMLIITSYIVYGYDMGICSDTDMKVVKEYLNEKKYGVF